MPEVLSYNRGVKRVWDRGVVLRLAVFGCALVPLISAGVMIGLLITFGERQWMYTGMTIVVAVTALMVLLGSVLLLERFQTGMPNVDRRTRMKRFVLDLLLLLAVWPLIGAMYYLWCVFGGRIQFEVVNASPSEIKIADAFPGLPGYVPSYSWNLGPGERAAFSMSRYRGIGGGIYSIQTSGVVFTLTYPVSGYVPWSGYRVEWNGQKWVQTR